MNDKETRNKMLRELVANENVGIALRDFLEEKMKEIDTVEGADKLEEFLGRQIAKQKLKELIRFFTPEPEKPIRKTNYE